MTEELKELSRLQVREDEELTDEQLSAIYGGFVAEVACPGKVIGGS